MAVFFNTAQLRAAGVNPAGTDVAAPTGLVTLEFDFDGTRLVTAATNTVDMFEIPAHCGVVVHGATVSNVRPGTATGTLAVHIGAAAAAGTAVTGLTGFNGAGAAGTRDVRLATAANTAANGATPSFLKLAFGTTGFGAGRCRVRVFCTILAPAPAN